MLITVLSAYDTRGRVSSIANENGTKGMWRRSSPSVTIPCYITDEGSRLKCDLERRIVDSNKQAQQHRDCIILFRNVLDMSKT